MKISKEFPPNWEQITKVFPVEGRKGIVITYGETCFFPTMEENEEFPVDLYAHESVHTRQQGESPQLWWDRYIEDPEFRKSQEVEAYAEQYKFVRNRWGNTRAKRLLVYLASDLSSEIYGLNITYAQAEKLIKQHEKSLS